MVSGYRKDIGWIESAAFSLHILDALADGDLPQSLRKMHNKHGELGRRLGFRAVGARGEFGLGCRKRADRTVGHVGPSTHLGQQSSKTTRRSQPRE